MKGTIPDLEFRILREILTADMAESFSEHGDALEEEDDCVIFKGSQLYTSLVQSGSLAEELEIEETALTTTAVTETHQQSVIKHSRYSTLTSVKRIWNSSCQKLKTRFLPDLSSIYCKHHQAVIKDLSASSCLEEDDGDFLQFYIHTSISNAESDTATRRSFRFVFDILVLLVALFVNQCLIRLVFNKSYPWSLMIVPAVPVVMLIALREGRGYKHRRKCKKVMLTYDDFVRKNETIAGKLKKCLRLIQETELISRGFTFVSQRNPLSRLEGGQKDSVTRQCPVLRKLVFTVAMEAVLVFREKTKSLFDLHPLSAEFDIQGAYLAYEPIQSYGPCLQVDAEDGEKLHSVTDGFSISALKGISHLFSLHQSEFIKALILVQQERMGKGRDVEFEELNLLEDISTRLEEWTVSLQKSHDFHDCAWMKREPVTREPRSHSNIEDIYVAVHSLDLHLQAALTRVRCLSELVQSFSDTGKTDNSIQVNDLLHHMQPIRAELESSKGCWEEGLNRMEKTARKSSSCMPHTSVKDDDSGLEKPLNTDVPARKIEDYIIEDQVFEGYTDTVEIASDHEWDRPLTAAEKKKMRREKEEALRMLSELKSVISVRAVETEKRENAAMLKMYPDLKSEKKPASHTESETLYYTKLNKTDATGTFSGRATEKFSGRMIRGFPIVVEKTGELCCEKSYVLNDKEEDKAPYVRDKLRVETVEIQKRVKYIGASDKQKQYISDKDLKIGNNSEFCSKGNKNSFFSSQGLRRLRKSSMLDLSDSDVESYHEDEIDNVQYSKRHEEKMPRLGLPLRKLITDEDNDDVERFSNIASDEVFKFRLPVRTLKERFENISGANLSLSSEIAEKAVARSKVMGLAETTFGGDVYGEYSSDGGNDDDDDKTEY